MRVILGSSSESRKKILRQLFPSFDVRSPNIDEKAIRHPDPLQLTSALAHAKADALIPPEPEDAFLITSDQVVAWNGHILEKPENASEARRFLEGYALFPAETVTTVLVTDLLNGQRFEGSDVARIWFSPLSEEVIQEALEDPRTYHRSGGFGVEDARLQPFITKIEGATDSIQGLPKDLLSSLLKEVEQQRKIARTHLDNRSSTLTAILLAQ